MGVEARIGQSLRQETIDEIVRRILTVTKPDRIILFGSAATGNTTPDSDIDLLVVERDVEWEIDAWLDETTRIRDAIGRIGRPVDVLLTTMQRFERFKDIIGGVEYPANKYGKVVYESG